MFDFYSLGKWAPARLGDYGIIIWDYLILQNIKEETNLKSWLALRVAK